MSLPQVRLPMDYTILIVDAEETIRTDVATMAAGLCLVRHAGSIADARPLLTRWPVHVVMVRDDLPGEAGIEFLAEIAEQFPTILSILYGEAPTLERALAAINRAGVWRYLTGAVTPAKLLGGAREAMACLETRAGRSVQAEELRVANEGLERKVEQRTRELVSLNEELRLVLDHLHTLVATDDLTGLYNRRVMMERIEEQFRQARRYRTTLSCLAWDIAGFERLNFTYGHDVGDAVLKQVAQRVRKQMREVDIPCRAAGDDFVVILPHTNSAQALIAAERLHLALTDQPYIVGELALTLDVYVGIAEITPSTIDANELFGRAMQAVHTARREKHDPPILIYPDPENASPDSVEYGTTKLPRDL